MKLPANLDHTRLPDTIRAAIARDHGPSPVVATAYLDTYLGVYSEFQIRGLVWKYDAAGRLIDVYRWRSTGLYSGRRHEVERQKLHARPPVLAYPSAPPQDFFDLARRMEGSGYDGCRDKAGPCYHVVDEGQTLGMVVQVRFSSEESGDNPQRQWLAVSPEGVVWSSYGRTREEAARHLLTDEARETTRRRLAA